MKILSLTLFFLILLSNTALALKCPDCPSGQVRTFVGNNCGDCIEIEQALIDAREACEKNISQYFNYIDLETKYGDIDQANQAKMYLKKTLLNQCMNKQTNSCLEMVRYIDTYYSHEGLLNRLEQKELKWTYIKLGCKNSTDESSALKKLYCRQEKKLFDEITYEPPIYQEKLDTRKTNIPLLLTTFRSTPYFDKGEIRGIRIFSIKSESPLTKLLIEEGDILLKLNKEQVVDGASFISTFAKVIEDESSYSVEIIRNGELKKLSGKYRK